MNIYVNNNLSYKYGDNEYLNRLLCRDVLPVCNILKNCVLYDKNKNIKISNNMLKFYINKKKQKKLIILFEKYSFIRNIFINMKEHFEKKKYKYSINWKFGL